MTTGSRDFLTKGSPDRRAGVGAAPLAKETQS